METTIRQKIEELVADDLDDEEFYDKLSLIVEEMNL